MSAPDTRDGSSCGGHGVNQTKFQKHMKGESTMFAKVPLPRMRSFPALAVCPWKKNGAGVLHLNILTASVVQHGSRAKRVVAEGRQCRMTSDTRFFRNMEYFPNFSSTA